MRKSLLIALTAILLIGAVPAFAQLEGDWRGTGDGVCSPPVGSTDFPIYGWQTWKGQILDDDFWGSWSDETGNYGNFKGKIVCLSVEEAYCEGEWTWFYETSGTISEINMGPFQMYFVYFPVETPYCYGKWQTNYSNEAGTMEGRMVF